MQIYYILLSNKQIKRVETEDAQFLAKIAKRMDSGESIPIGGTIYKGWEILRVMSEKDYDEYRHETLRVEKNKKKESMIRQGFWQCRYSYWHNRGETCGHDLAIGGKGQASPLDTFVPYQQQPYLEARSQKLALQEGFHGEKKISSVHSIIQEKKRKHE